MYLCGSLSRFKFPPLILHLPDIPAKKIPSIIFDHCGCLIVLKTTPAKWLPLDLLFSAPTVETCFPRPRVVRRTFCSANAVVLRTKVS